MGKALRFPEPVRLGARSRGSRRACGSPGPRAVSGAAAAPAVSFHAASRLGAAPFSLHSGLGTDPQLTCPSTSARTLRTAHCGPQAGMSRTQLFGVGAEPPGWGWGGEVYSRVGRG